MATVREFIADLRATALAEGYGSGDDLQVGVGKDGSIRLFPASYDKQAWEKIRMATAEDIAGG